MPDETTKEYIEAVGRRKTAIARVRLTPAAKTVIAVNDQEFDIFFKTPELRRNALSSLAAGAGEKKYKITAHIQGGGVVGQAEAFRHAIARILVKIEPDIKKKLKNAGFIKRDPRMKERRKFGLKKARKAPQWSKR